VYTYRFEEGVVGGRQESFLLSSITEVSVQRRRIGGGRPLDINQQRQRLETEWTAFGALAQAFNIARRGKRVQPEEILVLGSHLAPELFDHKVSLLAEAYEPELVRDFRAQADAETSAQRREISPTAMLDIAIDECERQVRHAPHSPLLQEKLLKLQHARNYLRGRHHTETNLIFRDVQAPHPDLPSVASHGHNYREFRLSNQRAIRIRVLHPDPPERATGADLIYEFCDQATKMARVALIQYKIWDGTTLYFSKSGNLTKQLTKLRRFTCEGGLCSSKEDSGPPRSYRLPYCAAFLRPTNRFQVPNARLISKGVHVPVCVALSQASANSSPVLKSADIRDRFISERCFDELFRTEMCGSRPVAYADLETVYRECRVLEGDETIQVYVQEFEEQ
jgi:hypothetical protein